MVNASETHPIASNLIEDSEDSASLPSVSPKAARKKRLSTFFRNHSIVLIVLLAIDLIYCHKIVTHFTTTAPRDDTDGAVFGWGFWHMAQTLAHGGNPFTTHDVFFPVGTRLAFHAYAPLVGLFMFPFVELFNISIAMNIEVLFSGFLIGISGYCLTLYLTKDRWAAFFGGTAMMLLPIRFERMTLHYNLSQFEFLAFGVLATLILFDNKTLRAAIMLGVVAGLSAGADFTILALVSCSVIVISLVRWRETFTKQTLKLLAISAVTCCVVSSPLLIAALGDIHAHELDPVTGWADANNGGADPISYIFPLGYQPFSPDFFLNARKTMPRLEALFPTFTVLVLATVAFLRVKFRHKSAITCVIAVFFVLSLGPFLSVWGHTGGFFTHMGQRFSIPLPYLAVVHIPVLNGLRAPARFGYMVIVLLVVMATMTVAHFRKRLSPRGATALVLVLLALVGFESFPDSTVPFVRPQKDIAPYDAIRKDPGNRAVLEIPLQWANGYFSLGDHTRKDGQLVYYATMYNKPLVSGSSGRYPQKRFHELFNIPAYNQILSLQGDIPSEPITFTAQDLAHIGIGYVVTHRDIPTPQATAYIDSLHLPILADDGTVRVYKVPSG